MREGYELATVGNYNLLQAHSVDKRKPGFRPIGILNSDQHEERKGNQMALETHVIVIEQQLIDRLLDCGGVTGVTIEHVRTSRHALHVLSTSQTLTDERIVQVFLCRAGGGIRCDRRTRCLVDHL